MQTQENQPNSEDFLKQQKKTSRTISLIHGVLVILLILFILGSAVRFIVFRQYMQTKESVFSDINTLKKLDTTLQDKLQAQETVLRKIQAKTEAPAQINPEKTMILPVMEAYHFARTANLILLANGDVKSARELLFESERNIAPFPALVKTREVISKDIINLQNYSAINTEVVILTLDSVIQKIANLQQIPNRSTYFAKGPQTEAVTNKKTTEIVSLGVWDKFIQNTKEALKNVVIIQKHETAIPTILSDEQLINIKLNIQFKLINAEWALLHKQPFVYQSSINEAENWLKTYFSESVLEEANLLTSLEKLKTVPIQAEPINVSNSVNALYSALLTLTGTVKQ